MIFPLESDYESIWSSFDSEGIAYAPLAISLRMISVLAKKKFIEQISSRFVAFAPRVPLCSRAYFCATIVLLLILNNVADVVVSRDSSHFLPLNSRPMARTSISLGDMIRRRIVAERPFILHAFYLLFSLISNELPLHFSSCRVKINHLR